MEKEGGHVSSIISAAIFIVLEIAAVCLLLRSSTLQNIWINRFSHRVMVTLWSGGEHFRNYFSLDKRNEELSEENIELSRLLGEMKTKEIAASSEDIFGCMNSSFTYTPATIVKMSRNSQRGYFILNKGSEDGITPQSGIITAHGAVGVVTAVDRHYSYGLSFMNVNSCISARIGHEGISGPMVWDGINTNKGVLKDIPLHLDVEPGDTVYTSGHSFIFPPDIPLGIAGGTSVVNGSTSEIEVTLFQDISRTRFVAIVKNNDFDEITKFEKEVAK